MRSPFRSQLSRRRRANAVPQRATRGADIACCCGVWLALIAFNSNVLASVLYDQTAGSYGPGLVSQNYSDYPADSSAGADDFLVTDAVGWSLSEIDIAGTFLYGAGPVISFAVNVYPDIGGLPAAGSVCSYAALAYTFDGNVDYSIVLPTRCALTQGHYWLSVAANMSYGSGGTFGWETFTGSFGTDNIWENPSGGLGHPCPTWHDIRYCDGNAYGTAFGFRIIGSLGATDLIFKDGFEGPCRDLSRLPNADRGTAC